MATGIEIVEIDGVRYVRADEARARVQKLLDSIDTLLRQSTTIEDQEVSHPRRNPRTKAEKEAATCRLCRGEGTVRMSTRDGHVDRSCIPCKGTGWITKRFRSPR